MQRIQTPTAVAEMFVDGPPNATHYSAIWSNNIQESLARPIEQQGILLDAANLDQWTLMLQSYRYLAGGMPTVEGGAQFRVLTGGFFTIATGGTFQVDSGATVTLSDGSTVNLLGDLTIGTDDTNTLAIESSITTVILANLGITGAFGGNPVDLPEGATVAAGKTVALAANTAITMDTTSSITMLAGGDIDLTDDTGVIQPGQVAFHSTAAPSGSNGVMMYKGRFLTLGVGGDVMKPALFFEDDEPGPVATGLVLQDAGVSVDIVMLTGEVVMVEYSLEAKQSNVANTVNIQIEANAGVIGTAEPYRGVVNDVYFTVRRVVKYTAVADAVVTFVGRFGAGATTSTIQNVHLSVRWAGLL